LGWGTGAARGQLRTVGSNGLVEFIGELGSVAQLANEGLSAAALHEGVVARSPVHSLAAERACAVDIARVGHSAALGFLEEESAGAHSEARRSKDGARAVEERDANDVVEDARAEAQAKRAVPLQAVFLDVGVLA